MSLVDALFVFVLFLSLAIGIDKIEKTIQHDLDFIINVQSTAYAKGYNDGKKEASLATVYLCRDWIPMAGYKAWRQCNMDYVVQQELEEAKK